METNYGIFFSGLCSTPNTVGLINWATGEKICEISCSRKTGKKTRKAFDKYSNILKRAYTPILTTKKEATN